MENNNSSNTKTYSHGALRISKRCCNSTYGICYRCNGCGYMTRMEKYNNLNESVEMLYKDSKSSIEMPETLLKDIYNLESSCKEILQILQKYNVDDKNIKKLLIKVKVLSSFVKKFSKLFGKFMKQIEKVNEISKTVKNCID